MSSPLIHISPTEPTALKSLGRVSTLPEQYGCDVLWIRDGKYYGVQRKEFQDLLSSVSDGRLGKELAQMRSAGVQGLLAIEGTISWTSEGALNNVYGAKWVVERWYGVILQAALEFGVATVQTKNLSETVRFVEIYYKWSLKDRHGSLLGRPSPKGLWGSSPSDEDYAIHVLTAVNGIGPENARAIYKAAGNRLPLKMDVEWGVIEAIKGLGPKKIKTLRDLFGGDDG